MSYKHILVLLLIFSKVAVAQNQQAEPFPFTSGEWLKYRISYSNFLNAGYSTIEVRDAVKDNKPTFHFVGTGKSTGVISLFFKVRDDYQSFMYKESLKPYRFIRKINEGGYTKDKEILFDYSKNEAIVKNYKHNTVKNYPITSNVQDILSSLYYLRSLDIETLTNDKYIEIPMFFDQEINNFKLEFLGEEIIRTKYGKVKSLVFRPYVQAGRVFKEQESVTIWVSADHNKIPLRIKASLAVGSIRADLDEFKGLANPFNIIFDN